MPSRPASRDAEKIDLERQNFRAQLETAINEEDDPLAVYNQFVQWTVKNYGENDPDSGLLELLEQVTREFKEDPVYKTDLRYLKLWSLYARQVERTAAIDIYADLLSNDIGISYSALYEEYAALLEADGRCVKEMFTLIVAFNLTDLSDGKKQRPYIVRGSSDKLGR